jgi:spermidine synthase
VEYVEVARAESERGELVLRERRPGEGAATPILELRANGVFVMDTAETTSEVALAAACLELVSEPRDVLVAGLGLGFTLQAVLTDLRVERCSVVEIEPALVQWMRDGTVPHGPTLLADERANVVVADISLALAEAREASYDLVLLDVDNGPGYLVHEANAALYEAPFLRLTRRALRPGGALAVWSSAESQTLEETLQAVYDDVEPLTYAVDLQGREETYWLYVARAENSDR